MKVLDFGLARAMGGTGSGPQTANSPTFTVRGTQNGVLLGTAQYMSPEQARGRTVDKRTDIWAFGCVLYEMLTGAPAFAGDGVAEVLANVIKTEPDWTAAPCGHARGAATVPAALPAEGPPAAVPRYRRRASRDGGRLRATCRDDATCVNAADDRTRDSPTPAGRSRSWRLPPRLRSSPSRPGRLRTCPKLVWRS